MAIIKEIWANAASQVKGSAPSSSRKYREIEWFSVFNDKWWLVIGDWPSIVENRDIIEFHDIFDTKKEGLNSINKTETAFWTDVVIKLGVNRAFSVFELLNTKWFLVPKAQPLIIWF